MNETAFFIHRRLNINELPERHKCSIVSVHFLLTFGQLGSTVANSVLPLYPLRPRPRIR